jgi:hypothetical protein
VSASWTEPSVSCAAGETSYSSFWVGLDGDTSSTVEQIGTSADCQNGTPTYYACYEMYPKLSGQLDLRRSRRQRQRQRRRGALRVVHAEPVGERERTSDDHRHESPRRTRLGGGDHGGVVVDHGPHGTLGLADFGNVAFSNATVNGAPLADANPDDITMQQGSTVKAQPSTLRSDSFSVTWKHA